jgi:2-methylisocitrate lyase-like PEP mutase family enzyme
MMPREPDWARPRPQELSLSSLVDRRAKFRALHQSGCFAIPNPWDGGSAQRLAKAGFEALASTSAGAAWALGRADGEMGLEEVLDHLRFMAKATDLPLNADFEAGFADTPEGVAANVARCVQTGVAGLSIEDWSGGAFYPIETAAARIRAARQAIDASGSGVLLVGRAEAFRMPILDLDEIIARLKAYSAAGADVLYAPGLKGLDEVARIVAVVDKPVNANLTATGLSVQDFAKVGVRRVSVGGALARATYAAFDDMARWLATEGKLPSDY